MACPKIGLECVRDLKQYRWYNGQRSKCDHVIRIPNNNEAYEIGLIKKAGDQEYTLLFDFFLGGNGIEELAGENCSKIVQRYSTEVAAKKLRQSGWRVNETKKQDGTVRLLATR